MTTRGRYEVQRYDASWGGWRAIERAFDDASPARYGSRHEARRIADDYTTTTGARTRVLDTKNGKAI